MVTFHNNLLHLAPKLICFYYYLQPLDFVNHSQAISCLMLFHALYIFFNDETYNNHKLCYLCLGVVTKLRLRPRRPSDFTV